MAYSQSIVNEQFIWDGVERWRTKLDDAVFTEKATAPSFLPSKKNDFFLTTTGNSSINTSGMSRLRECLYVGITDSYRGAIRMFALKARRRLTAKAD
jgi:hypothetical protein